MRSGEGSFATRPTGDDTPRVEELPERRYAVRRHNGGLDTVEETRRPLYQHMIMHELVGGPPVLRFPVEVDGEAAHVGDASDAIDVLVGATCGFEGDQEVTVDVLPRGWYVIQDYEGPEADLPAARSALAAWALTHGHRPRGDLLQVHMMDTIDGETEQQLQLPIS